MSPIRWISLAIILAVTIIGSGHVIAQDAGSDTITICASPDAGDDIRPIQVTQEEYDAYVAATGITPLTPDAAGRCPFSIYFTPTGASPSAEPTSTLTGSAPIVLPSTGVGTASQR